MLLLRPQVSVSDGSGRLIRRLAGRGRCTEFSVLGVVDTRFGQPASSGRWAVEVRVFTHADMSMITYSVDVYRSRPIGASILCLALKGLHTQAGWACWWRVATCSHGLHRSTLWVKKRIHYNIVHNFPKCWPIFKFFSLTDSIANTQQNRH